jgi:hypothetical protein
MSYRDTLFFGVIACRELVPDVEVLTAYLTEELQVLADAVKPRARR